MIFKGHQQMPVEVRTSLGGDATPFTKENVKGSKNRIIAFIFYLIRFEEFLIYIIKYNRFSIFIPLAGSNVRLNIFYFDVFAGIRIGFPIPRFKFF